MSGKEASPAKQNGKWRLFSAWFPVLFCALVIALESQTWFGADNTSGPLRVAWEFVFGPVSNRKWGAIHHMIRKTGHFTGYGLLSLSWLRAFRLALQRPSFSPRFWLKPHALAMLGTFLIACSDELHQAFLPNRTGRFQDVLIDCSGALFMQCVAAIWFRLWAA
jgi:VanZ family protein